MRFPIVRLLFLGCAVVTLAGSGAQARDDKEIVLKPGDAAPVFASMDDTGKAWKSSDHVGKGIVVVYFYPADMTGGCTKQACGFRDDMQILKEKGITVVGVSCDTVKSHAVFKEFHRLPFTLLADEDGSVAKKFGVPLGKGGTVKTKDIGGNAVEMVRGGTAKRWTFVIGKDGKLLFKNTEVKAAEDSKKILEVIALQK